MSISLNQPIALQLGKLSLQIAEVEVIGRELDDDGNIVVTMKGIAEQALPPQPKAEKSEPRSKPALWKLTNIKTKQEVVRQRSSLKTWASKYDITKKSIDELFAIACPKDKHKREWPNRASHGDWMLEMLDPE